MANTRLAITNRIASAALKNGTGGAAPALEQASPYVMTNAQNNDRYNVWKTTSAPPGLVYVDFDLGSNIALSCAAVLGFRSYTPSTGYVNTCEVYTAPSSAGYVPASWTSQGIIYIEALSNKRDSGITFNQVSARYIRFAFSTFGTIQFSVGRLFAGLALDLGGIHSPGGSKTTIKNRIETPLPGGAIVLNTIGDDGAEWSMPWSSIDTTTRGYWTSAFNDGQSFVLIDHEDKFYEVTNTGGQYSEAIGFSSLYDMSISLKRLP